MSNKLFDIIPPQYNESYSKTVTLPHKRRFRIGYFILTLIIVLCLGAYFFIKPSLKIDLWPNLIDDHYSILVRISTSTSAVDLNSLSIPGSILEKEEEVSKKFDTSRETVRNKAQGVIRVYNDYSSQPITLIKNTRFMSSSGKVFLATTKFTIPGKPRYKDVKVIAVEPGKDYNIKPSSFSIPGLRGTPLYTSVYGKSFQTMSGGYVGNIYRVKKDDLDNAEKTLLALGVNKLRGELLHSHMDNVVVLDGTINCSMDDFFPLAEVGQEVPSFAVKEKIKATALSFKKDDLKALIQKYALSKLSDGQTIDPDYLNFSFNQNSFHTGDLLKVEINSHRYSKLNKELLKKRIAGCKKSDISGSILDFYPHLITPPEISLVPFWSQRAPLDESRIKIDIHLKS